MIWRFARGLGDAVVLIVCIPIVGILWVADHVRSSLKAHIIRTEFNGDEDAYERAKWKRS